MIVIWTAGACCNFSLRFKEITCGVMSRKILAKLVHDPFASHRWCSVWWIVNLMRDFFQIRRLMHAMNPPRLHRATSYQSVVRTANHKISRSLNRSPFCVRSRKSRPEIPFRNVKKMICESLEKGKILCLVMKYFWLFWRLSFFSVRAFRKYLINGFEVMINKSEVLCKYRRFIMQLK